MEKDKRELMPMPEMQALAKATATAGLFAGYDSPDKCLVMMAIAQAEGKHPIEAMMRYDIISSKQGIRPAKKAQAMLDDFIAAGGQVEWLETSATKAEAIFTGPGMKPLKLAYSIEQARRAGLTEKWVWKAYPDNLLRARLISNALKMISPASTSLLYSSEEVQDFDRDPNEIQAEVEVVEEEGPEPLPGDKGDLYKRFLDRAAELKDQVGVFVYYRTLEEFGRKHANEFGGEDLKRGGVGVDFINRLDEFASLKEEINKLADYNTLMEAVQTEHPEWTTSGMLDYLQSVLTELHEGEFEAEE